MVNDQNLLYISIFTTIGNTPEKFLHTLQYLLFEKAAREDGIEKKRDETRDSLNEHLEDASHAREY